jgi:hypothetical protein
MAGTITSRSPLKLACPPRRGSWLSVPRGVYTPAMNRLRALWSGDLPLGEAFWTYAVVVALAVNVSTTLAFLALISANRPIAALFVGYALSVPYNVAALVGVWRSAAHYPGARLHADLARIVSLVGLVLLSLT